LFKQIKGNARYCLLFEPMFLIPYNMVITYASVYMLELGLGNSQIGLIATIGSALQVFTSLISGYLTDRLGRKKALFIFDLLCWCVPALIWIFADNIWYFVIAVIINSLVKIPTTAFYCLLIEDTPIAVRSKVFSILQFTGAAGGVFAPLAAILIVHYDLVTSVRLMYALFFLSTTAMVISRHYYLYDTETSVTKRGEAAGDTLRTIAKQYRSAAGSLFRNRSVMPIMFVYVLFNFQIIIKNTFLSLYMLEALKFDTTTIAWYPAISSIAMLAALFLVIPRLNQSRMFVYITMGLAVTVLSYVLLLISPPQSLTFLILTTVLHAIGTLLILPFLESFLSNVVNDSERAKFYALFTVCIMLFTAPAGVLGGWSYGIRPGIPFFLIAVGLLMCIGVMIWEGKRISKLDRNKAIHLGTGV
jgi:DHA1 family tetracycline resistance protein-like MFS transporter